MSEHLVVENRYNAVIDSGAYFAKVVDGNSETLRILNGDKECLERLMQEVKPLVEQAYEYVKDNPIKVGRHAILPNGVLVIRSPKGKARYLVHSDEVLVRLNVRGQFDESSIRDALIGKQEYKF